MMILEVWFDSVDSNAQASVVFTQPATIMMRIPRIGEKVGVWHAPKAEHLLTLMYVVDVRHYIKQGSPDSQEIHVMCSSRP
jgi:hypothetical protein